jgi:hypothetical protein
LNESDLVETYPRLWHMAEDGSWDSIRQRGLLSASALLDLYRVYGTRRAELESSRRPESVSIRRVGLPNAVLRDQKPMSNAALAHCLRDGITPAQWYEKLNKHAFFWLSRERLRRLLGANDYRNQPQVVLTLDTRSVIAAHKHQIELSPINSGSTLFNPQPRGHDTFLPIDDYPFEYWRKRRPLPDAVVELTVLYAVQNILQHVIAVHRVVNQATQELWRLNDTKH